MNVKSILNQYHLKGGTNDQFFLVNNEIINKIITYSELSINDIVLEIGGGIGNLSEKICVHVKKLYIVEKDPLMVNILNERLIKIQNFKNIEIINENILNINLNSLNITKIISNLPYSISSEFTIKLIKEKPIFSILMYQKEFAERLTSINNSKKYGKITVYCQEKLNIKKLQEVKRNNFTPVPNVDSMIIKITPNIIKYDKIINSLEYKNLLNVLFQHKRKKIKTIISLKKNELKLYDIKERIFKDKDKIKYFESRPENLDINDFIILTKYLYKQN